MCTYPTMSLDEIIAVPIPQIADANSILWLWTTNAHMREAFQIVDAWGFEPKTILTWKKSKMGLGEWLRGITEHCLMCVKGKPLIQLTNQTTFIEGKTREHSRKPDEFYAMVESLCPGRKIDVFAREERKNWNTWGIMEKMGESLYK